MSLNTLIDRLLCGLSGHEYICHREGTRIFLRCACGHETPGWRDLGTVPARTEAPRRWLAWGKA
jgi:hypothetical protein